MEENSRDTRSFHHDANFTSLPTRGKAEHPIINRLYHLSSTAGTHEIHVPYRVFIVSKFRDAGLGHATKVVMICLSALSAVLVRQDFISIPAEHGPKGSRQDEGADAALQTALLCLPAGNESTRQITLHDHAFLRTHFQRTLSVQMCLDADFD